MALVEYLPPSVPANPKVGDRIIFTDELRDNATNQVRGTRGGLCTCVQEAAVDNKILFECQTTYTLSDPQGHVTTRGSVLLPGEVGQTVKLAIAGGTDAYAKARGQATLTYLGGGQWRIVLEIEV